MVRNEFLQIAARVRKLERNSVRLLDALEWLVHLHHGVSKDGSREIADGEWRWAIKSAEAAIAHVKGERGGRSEGHT